MAVIILISVVSALYVYSKLESVKKVPISKDDKELKIDKKAEPYGDDVINIAFLVWIEEKKRNLQDLML